MFPEPITIVDIREVPEAIPTLARWHEAEWGTPAIRGGLQRRIERLKLHLGKRTIPSTFVALSADGEPRGSAALILHDMNSRMQFRPWLACVYVDPVCRGQGIGSDLVRRVTHFAADHRIARVYLFTPDRAPFYERLGWRVLEQTRYNGKLMDVMMIETWQG